MLRKDVLLQPRKTRIETLESEAKLLTAFILPLPPVMRSDGAVDLSTDGEIVRDSVRGQAVGVSLGGNRRPCDIHA